MGAALTPAADAERVRQTDRDPNNGHPGSGGAGTICRRAGLFWCLAGAAGGAIHIVLLALCGAVVGYVCDRYLRRNLLSALLMSLGCLIFCQGVLFLVQVFLGHVGFGAGLLPVLRQIGLSLLAAPPVYLAAWLIRKAGA